MLIYKIFLENSKNRTKSIKITKNKGEKTQGEEHLNLEAKLRFEYHD